MRTLLIILVASTTLLAACSQSHVEKEQTTLLKDLPGQWVLESYNADRGYVLRKDGTRYRATCDYHFTGPILQDEQHPNEPQLSLTPNHGFPIAQNDIGECTQILAYIHKAVPFQQYASYPPDRLFFLHKASGSSYIEGITEFTIIEAE